MSDANNIKAATEYGTYIAMQQLSGAADSGNFLPTGSVGIIYLASGSTGAGAGDGVHNVPNNYALSADGTKFHFTSPISSSNMSASTIVAGHFFGDGQYLDNVTISEFAADDLTAGDAAVTLGNGSTSANVTIDSGLNVIIDADNSGLILLKDGGAVYGGIKHAQGIGSETQDLVISASYTDADIVFSGSDNGTAIKSVTMDMSDAGTLIAHAKFTAVDQARLLGGATVSGNLDVVGLLVAANEAQLKNGATVSGSFHALGNSALGNASSDVVTIAASLTASAGATISGKEIVISGSSGYINLGGGTSAGNVSISGSLIVGADIRADAQDGATLGADGFEFSDLYLADGAVCYFGDDGEVTLTHVADTGLLLSDDSGVGTTKLMFGDSACFIHQQADGQLGIDADNTINITAPTVDIDAATDCNISAYLTVGDEARFAQGATVSGNLDVVGYLVSNNEAQLKAGATVSGSFHALGGANLGNANTDVVNVGAQLTASYGILAGHAGVGNTLISGSGGFLDLQAAAGNLLLSGSIIVGDAIKADAQDGATLGADGFEFSDLYLADGAVCYFGDDGEVTLTHVADTGLLLSDDSGVGTTKLMFGDQACFIQQQADGQLGVDADSIINLTAPTLDIDSSTAVLITSPSVVIDSSTSDKPQVEIKCSNADANPPTLLFNHDSGSPADDDELGEIVFNGDDDGGTSTMFAKIVANSTDVSNGSEDGSLTLKCRVAGAVVDVATFHDGTYGLTLVNNSAHGVIKAHSLATYSDETLKTNINPIDSALNKVQQLQGVTYDWLSDGSQDIGFIAQEVKEVIPQVVYGGKEDGDLGLDYGSLTALLTEAIKEQQSQIESLRTELDKKSDK